jgi:hypothetical protein
MENLLDVYKSLVYKTSSWVLFENGTCVVPKEPAADLKKQAVNIMHAWEGMRTGEIGDFKVYHPRDLPGWVVGCEHPEVFAFVPKDEFTDPKSPTDSMRGIAGMKRIIADAESLHIVHVEDKRT